MVHGNLIARIEGALEEQLPAGCTAGVFPGAAACVATWDGGGWQQVQLVAGVRAEGGAPVTRDTIYDLASLTKPFVATAALRLHQRGVFSLDARVDELIVEARGLPVGEQNWEKVLSHRAGLEAWAPFYEEVPAEP